MPRKKEAARKKASSNEKPNTKHNTDSKEEKTEGAKKQKLDRREFLTKKIVDLENKLIVAKQELQKLDEEEKVKLDTKETTETERKLSFQLDK